LSYFNCSKALQSVTSESDVCLMYVCPYISKTTYPYFTIFSVHYLWPWLGPALSLTTQQCNILSTSGFVDDVMFSHNGVYIVAGQHWSSTSDPSPPVGVTWTCRSLAANDLIGQRFPFPCSATLPASYAGFSQTGWDSSQPHPLLCAVQCGSEAVGVSGTCSAAQDEGADPRRGDCVCRPGDRRSHPVDDTDSVCRLHGADHCPQDQHHLGLWQVTHAFSRDLSFLYFWHTLRLCPSVGPCAVNV